MTSDMNRRYFLSTPAAAAAASALNAAPVATPKGKMKLGTQNADDATSLGVFAAFGVTHICSTLPSRRLDEKWSVDSLMRLRERVEKAGIALEMVPLPLSSAPVAKHEYPDLMLGKSPGRDKAVEEIQQILRNVAKAGIPAVKYNMSMLGVVRTPRTPGRGASDLSTFKYEGAEQVPLDFGPVPADVYWERITWFLDRVIPVANELKIKMACHPHDPAMPVGKGWRGVETVLSPEGLKKFVSIQESPYHGLNFCQGTVTEGLKDPNKEIHHYIEYFGSRKKIFNVHFRNIKGKFLDFAESFHDNGDVDMFACARTYKKVGYDGMLMPDHVPHVEGDPGSKAGFAFAFGYIRAILQSVQGA
jgi:mannonate dehydratase